MEKDKGDIIKFPTLAERDRQRREKERQEKAWRKEYKKNTQVPFFNTAKIPPATRIFFAVFILVHLLSLFFLDDPGRYDLHLKAGFVPGVFTGESPWSWSALLTPLSYIFIHSGWMHVGFNGVMLLALGVFFEREFGTRRMVFFFFSCGLLGALFYFVLNPFSIVPVIGASGSISGLFAVTLLIMHERGLMGPMGRRGPWPLIGIWLLLIVGMGVLGGGNVAWQAHLGGFLGGLLLLYLWRKKLL